MNENEIPEAFFGEIRKLCLSRNFGTLSKSEFDGLVFHYYLRLKNARRKEDDSSEYVSDYEIGKELGLTIQRVRSLREKDALRRTDEREWKTMFLQCVRKAAYDENSGLVKFLIPDVNVIKEVRHLLETLGLYDEYQLNPKLFQCKLDVFLSLCVSIQGSINQDDDSASRVGRNVLALLRELPDETISNAAGTTKDKTLREIQKGVNAVVGALIRQIPIVGEPLNELVHTISRIVKITGGRNDVLAHSLATHNQ